MTVGTNINGMGRPHGEVGQLVFASEALYAQLRWAITYSMRSLEVIGDYDLRFPFSCHQVHCQALRGEELFVDMRITAYPNQRSPVPEGANDGITMAPKPCSTLFHRILRSETR